MAGNHNRGSGQPAKLSLQQRKKMLVVEGAIYRSEILGARHAVRASLDPRALAKSAIGHFTATATSSVENFFKLDNLKNGGLKSLLPLLMTGASLLSKRGLVRPALKVALVVGAAAAAYFVVQKKRQGQNRTDENQKDEQPLGPFE